MTEQCSWCGFVIVKEDESLELREFHTSGKTCFYFDNFDCLVRWTKANCKTDIIGELNES